MTTERALLDRIHATPDDDRPREVYADWLDDQGRRADADTLRAALALARTDPFDPALAARAARALPDIERALTTMLTDDAHAELVLDRGLPWRLETADVGVVEQVAARWPDLRALTFRGDASARTLERLARALPGLQELHCTQSVNLVALGPLWPDLRSLTPGSYVVPADAHLLGKLACAPSLRQLDLRFQAWLDTPPDLGPLARFTNLRVSPGHLAPATVEALARLPLTDLNLPDGAHLDVLERYPPTRLPGRVALGNWTDRHTAQRDRFAGRTLIQPLTWRPVSAGLRLTGDWPRASY